MNLNLGGVTIGGVTIDCAEPRKLADFWTQALDLEVAFDADGYFLMRGPGPTWSSPISVSRRSRSPEPAKNRVHIDFSTADRAGEVARLVSLGGVAGETPEVPGLTWTVLSDPEGNEFRVRSPHG